jgi:DNA mismatch repair protein MutS2
MHAAVLQALEFTRIVDVLRGCAVTPLGADRLANLRPLADPRKVAQQLAATSEGVRFNELVGGFALTAPSDLASILASLAVEGRPLEALRLLALAEYLDSVDLTRGAIRRTEHAFPILKALAESGSSFRGEIAETRHKIEPSGEVADGASPELKSVRERLRRQRTRLKGTLESFLRNRDTAKYLQDQVVTDRNGRFVLVVRAEHRSAIPGIVHGSSASGASLYLEPLSTVEINNDIVALEQQEAEEVRRILLGLTDQYRRRALDLQRTIEVATELDVIQAKARLSAIVSGVEPALSSDGAFELLAARHPLLIPAIADRLGAPRAPRGGSDAGHGDAVAATAQDPVPVDIKLLPGTTVLVITGPNTGGKTVALKTAGLLVLMAQAGLHVPAEAGSRVPVFRSVFADIGDEQSIAANLSTFSWHMTNIVEMDRSLALPALVLLDEVGAGTDPIEGGALGLAIVDHLRSRGAHVVATTHYEPLKSYAATTTGVVCAAFGFDPESFAPTYRLQYGTPGRSLALEIAGRLGLNPAILEQARGNISAREAQLAEHLAKIDADMRSLEHERRLVSREREAATESEARLKAREQALRERENRLRQRADEEISARVRAARDDIDKVVDELRQEVERLGAEASRRALHGRPISTGEPGAARAHAKAALEDVAGRLHESPDGAAAVVPPAPAGPAARVGDRVLLRGLGVEGRVLAVQAGEAEVDVRGKRLRAQVAELHVVGGPAPPEASRVSVNVMISARESIATEINVIGCSVDEALGRIDRFLDDLLLTDERQVRIIHGFGTGQLRRSIGEYLDRHPLVASHQPAPQDRGGGGVTVAELKD